MNSGTELRQRYAMAHEQGMQARRGGKSRAANPFRGSTPQLRDLRDEWDRGWVEENAMRRRTG